MQVFRLAATVFKAEFCNFNGELGVCRLDVVAFAIEVTKFKLEFDDCNSEFVVRNDELGVLKDEFGLFKDLIVVSMVNSEFARAFFPTSRAILAISRRK